jgi:hypothetical protein
MKLRILTSIKRMSMCLLLVSAPAAGVAVTGCDSTTSPGGGDKCKKGCPCGLACIDCSKTCHKDAEYARTGVVPDSLSPK